MWNIFFHEKNLKIFLTLGNNTLIQICLKHKTSMPNCTWRLDQSNHPHRLKSYRNLHCKLTRRVIMGIRYTKRGWLLYIELMMDERCTRMLLDLVRNKPSPLFFGSSKYSFGDWGPSAERETDPALCWGLSDWGIWVKDTCNRSLWSFGSCVTTVLWLMCFALRLKCVFNLVIVCFGFYRLDVRRWEMVFFWFKDEWLIWICDFLLNSCEIYLFKGKNVDSNFISD